MHVSPFDGHASTSFEANVAYMRRQHGFIVPMAGLLDAPGLFAHVQRKVEVERRCVSCHRRFRTLEGVRAHMHAKGHCRLHAEESDERCLLELAPFYDPEAAPWLRARVGRMDGLGEYVLPSGRTLGSRTLRAAYRQTYRTEDTRLSILAARRNYHQRVRLRAGVAHASGSASGASSSNTALATAHADLAASAAQRAARKAEHRLLLGSFAYAKGTSKALASSYVFKADFADNKHTRALQHHGYGGFGGGAHFTMGHSRQFNRGVRVQGEMLRKAGKTKGRQMAAKVAAKAARGANQSGGAGKSS